VSEEGLVVEWGADRGLVVAHKCVRGGRSGDRADGPTSSQSVQ